MPYQIPDFESLVVTRLQVNNTELRASGLKAIYAQPPITAPDIGDYPLASVRIGAMRSPVPAFTAGLVIVTRDYITDLPVAPLTNTMDTTNQGADANTLTLKWFAIVRNYYINHPHLQTDANNGTDPLAYMYGDLELQDNGTVQLTAPGGTTYVGLRYTLTITMRARATRIG